ncbi:hypothetical protein ACNOYE_25210 [Nannocystaceae bacterium ST9]
MPRAAIHQLVVTNILEVHELDDLPDEDRRLWADDYRHFSGKALYWPEPGRVTFLSHWPLDELAATLPESALLDQTRDFVRVAMASDSLCADVLADPIALERLIARFEAGATIELLAWAASPALARLAAALRERGFTVSPSPERLARSAEVEHRLRARQPMIELLESLPEVARLRPTTVSLADWSAVREFLAGRELGNGWVIKGCDSVAGCGVMMIDHETERARVLASERPSRSLAEAGFYLLMKPPYVVEELVGERSSNLSPTLDMYVDEASIRFVGVGWQVLERKAGYVGIVSGPRLIVPLEVMTAANAIAEALRARGYVGYFNIDFLVTLADEWSIMEINVRRSSPIDHFHTLARRPPLAPDSLVVSLDYSSPACAERWLAAAAAPDSGVVAARRLGDRVSRARWVGLMLHADSAGALARTLERAEHDGDDDLRELLACLLARDQLTPPTRRAATR